MSSIKEDYIVCKDVYVQPGKPGGVTVIHLSFEDQEMLKHRAAFAVKNNYLDTVLKSLSRLQPIRPSNLVPATEPMSAVEERETIPAKKRA